MVEHAIRRIKTFKIMSSKFRNRLERYDNIMSITSGFVDLRLMLQEGSKLRDLIG